MIARPENTEFAPFASAVFRVAAEVEAAEAEIKSAILAAARAGDCAAVIDIVERWQSGPAVEVLLPPASPPESPPGNPLDRCGEMSVPVAPSRPTSARKE